MAKVQRKNELSKKVSLYFPRLWGFLAFGDSSPSVGLSPWRWAVARAVARAVAVRWLQAHKEVARSLVGVMSAHIGSSGCIWYHSASALAKLVLGY